MNFFSKKKENLIILEDNVLKKNMSMNNFLISWFGNVFEMKQNFIFSKEKEYLIMHSEFKFNSTMTGFEVFSSNNGNIEIKVVYFFLILFLKLSI